MSADKPMPVVRPVSRTRLADTVTRQLRELISTGQLRAGTRLRQVELAERLGVSRTPLREAFRILEKDGLVRVSQRSGTVEVVEITPKDLTSMYQMREVIDGLAARKAALAMSDDDLAALGELLQEMQDSIVPYDPVRRTEAHIRFHSLIAEASGNEYLQKFLPLVRVSSAALYLPFIDDPSAVELVTSAGTTTQQEILSVNGSFHDAIYQALVARNPKRAEAAARRHIRSTLRNVDRIGDWARSIDTVRRVHRHDGES